MDLQIFRRNMHALLVAKKITESELARHLKIVHSTLNKVITGQTEDPRVSTMLPIAKYVGVSVERLVSEVINFEHLLSRQETETSTKDLAYLPVLGWSEILKMRPAVSALSRANWAQWVALNAMSKKKYSKKSFVTLLKGQSLPSPFSEAIYIVVDPEQRFYSQSYVLVQTVLDEELVIKQVVMEGHQLWLQSLHKGIPSQRHEKENVEIVGVLTELQLSLTTHP